MCYTKILRGSQTNNPAVGSVSKQLEDEIDVTGFSQASNQYFIQPARLVGVPTVPAGHPQPFFASIKYNDRTIRKY